MASVSNAFDALQSGAAVSSKKTKRKKKKSAASEVSTESNPLAPRSLPSAHELETQAASVSAETRLELWERWTNDLIDEENLRRGPFVDDSGKPAFLRSALLASRALETLAETAVDSAVLEDQGNVLYRLFKAVFTSVEAEMLQQLVFAIVKVSSLARGKGTEVMFSAKRALRDIVASVKKLEMQDTTQNLKKKPTTRFERNVAKKPYKHDKKAELHEALEWVRTQQSVVDEVDDEAMDAVGGASISRSILDFQVALSLASKPVEEIVTSKKGRKNKNKGSVQMSPLLDSLRQEEAAHAAEEARLNEEISCLEMKLKGLKSQLASLHVTRQQVQQRKDAMLNSISSGQSLSNGTALISPEEQNEAIGCLEQVVTQLQSASGQSDEHKREFAASYVDALERFYSLCFSRQEDLVKTVRFLKDSIQRRMEQEEKMKEIASAALTKDILRTQQHSKHELEQQLKDAMFDSGDLIIKVTRVDSDLNQREDFIRKHVSPHSIDALQKGAVRIKQQHSEIKHVAEEKREVAPSVMEVVREPESATKKKIDTKEIIKEEEMRAREEIAARMQLKSRKTPTSSQSDDLFSPKSKSSSKVMEAPRPPPQVPQAPQAPPPVPPPYQRVVYVTPNGETLDPRFVPAPMGPPMMYTQPPFRPMPPHPMMPGDPEMYHPMMQHPYHPPVNPAGPVQRPPPVQHSPPPSTSPPVSDAPVTGSSSKPRMAWKKIGDQTPSEKDHPDLPTPGEARKLGKL